VRVLIVSKRVTSEGEVLPVYQRELSLGGNGEEGDNEGRLFLVWPVIVQHCISESSPLWDVSADDLVSGLKHFEIIVVLEGIVECTGMTTQASAKARYPLAVRTGRTFTGRTYGRSFLTAVRTGRTYGQRRHLFLF